MELRDRIAAAISSVRIQRDGDSYAMADAVIAELKLHPVESLDRRFIRWVTAWRNNPELGDSHE